MKQIFTSLLLLVTALTIAQEWEVVGSPGFSEGESYHINMTFDSAGTPYVVYRDWAAEAPGTLSKFNGTSWETVGGTHFSEGEVNDPWVAINSENIPYVAYQDAVTGERATVKGFNGTEWETVGNAGFSAGQAIFTRLAFDSSGVPYVAYVDSANGYRITVMKLNGNLWEPVGQVGVTTENSALPSLAIDSEDNIYISYTVFNWSAFSYSVSVMKFDGEAWETLGTFEQGSNSPSLAIGNDGAPYVAYSGWNNGPLMEVKKYNGEGWDSIGDFGDLHGELSLTINSTGTPYVFFPNTYDGILRVMRYNGAVWENMGNLAISPWHKDIKIDPSGTPYIAYYDNWNSGRATVQKFAAPVCENCTKLVAGSCGVTVSGFNQTLTATAVPGAQNYRFRVTNGSNVQVKERGATNSFRLNMLGDYAYNTTYTVEVGIKIDGEWGEYGEACNVTTPAIPAAQLEAAYCNTTLASFNSNVYANVIPLASAYRFRVSDGTTTEEIVRSTKAFRINMTTFYNYNTTYDVDVAVMVDGVWSDYGPVCTLTTPTAPSATLMPELCGSTVGASSQVVSVAVPLAQGYRFRVTDGVSTQEITRPRRGFRLNMLSFYANNTTYSVEVAVLLNGVWTAYGTACEVTSSASGMRQGMMNDSDEVMEPEFTAYPNPFESSFRISFDTYSDAPVHIVAYDVTGKMLENKTVSPDALEALRIGENFAAGIYNIIATQGDFSKSFKVVKK